MVGLEFMLIDRRMSDEEITMQVVEDLRQYALKPSRLGLSDDGVSDCRRRIIELIALRRPKSIVHPALLLPRV